jgi:type II restriction/modification system DNA methylase subunit YeeA
MIKLLNILIERDFERKESIKKTFHTYSCYFIVKFKKKINRLQAVERVRGIKTVTIVDLRGDEKLEKINRRLVDYEYSSVEVKFITNKNPKDQVEFIRKAMVSSDKDKGIDNIVGIVAASARVETLKKID